VAEVVKRTTRTTWWAVGFTNSLELVSRDMEKNHGNTPPDAPLRQAAAVARRCGKIAKGRSLRGGKVTTEAIIHARCVSNKDAVTPASFHAFIQNGILTNFPSVPAGPRALAESVPMRIHTK
jgi:hypothetical protein